MEWYLILTVIIASLAVLIGLSALFYKAFFKRFYDVILSGIALLVLSPLFVMLIIIGAVAMHGNPFFTQPRPGKFDKKLGKEKIFKLIKFRTMSNKKDKDGKLLPDKERLNGYGRFLRSTSLDELPELVQIFMGTMSIVGPRPQLVRDMVFMTEQQRKRHSVTPGLTGLAQVNGRNNIPWEVKFEKDLEYIEKMSFFFDLKILFMTVFKVFKREDIAAENHDTVDDFGDCLLREGKIEKEEYDRKQKEALALLEEQGF